MLLVYCAVRSFQIWPIILCLGIIADPISPEDEAILDAPLVEEYGWGPGELVAVYDDWEPD